ncbi:MAG: tetratricopeptide repeat protein [Caulobacteraceae bacterium]
MKRIILITTTIFIALSLFTVNADDSSKTVQELLQQVENLLYRTLPVKESEERALGVLDEIIALDPKCELAYDYKAYALNSLGRGSDGADVYDAAIKAIPNDDMLYLKKADYLLINLKRYNDAVTFYDKALQSKNAEFLRMNSDYLLRYKAEALYQMKRYSEAIKCYDKLIAESGYYYEFEYGMNKGLALMELKKYNEASKWFNEFKRHLVPYEYEQYAKVYYSSASAYSMLKKVPQALTDLELAIKYDKSYKDKAKTEKYFKNISSNKKFISILTFEENLLKKTKLGKGFYVIDHLTYDINGDKVADEVVLVGHENTTDEFNVDQVALIIVDNKSGKYNIITPKYNYGLIYSNRKDYLFSNDSNGDGIKDVTVQIGNRFSKGGWTACSYSFKGNKPVMIFAKEIR